MVTALQQMTTLEVSPPLVPKEPGLLIATLSNLPLAKRKLFNFNFKSAKLSPPGVPLLLELAGILNMVLFLSTLFQAPNYLH